MPHVLGQRLKGLGIQLPEGDRQYLLCVGLAELIAYFLRGACNGVEAWAFGHHVHGKPPCWIS